MAVIVGFVAREVLGRAIGAWFARVGEVGVCAYGVRVFPRVPNGRRAEDSGPILPHVERDGEFHTLECTGDLAGSLRTTVPRRKEDGRGPDGSGRGLATGRLKASWDPEAGRVGARPPRRSPDAL